MQNMQDGRPVIVTEPVMRPHHCALAPQIARDPEGFIDTGVKLTGVAPRVYVSISAFRDLARRLDYTAPEARDELNARITELEAELQVLRDQLATRDSELEAVAVLKRAGYKPQAPRAPRAKAAMA